MTATNILPSREVLLASLRYDPVSGLLHWREREDVRPEWNTRYAGKSAGNRDTHGYVRVHVNGQKCWAHRVIWKMVNGEDPADTVDHINGDRSDNRIANLRLATNAQNLCNRGPQKNNTSGFKGVYFSRAAQKWVAQIKIAGRWKYLGLYLTREAAHEAYSAASETTHGEFGRAA